MLTDYNFASKKVLILGFGREGQATLKFLISKWPKIDVAVADQRKTDELTDNEKKLLSDLPSENLQFGSDYLDGLDKFDIIIKSPGINPRKKKITNAVRNGTHLTSGTNLFFSFKKGRVIAVTGSKGKSTTSSMIYDVLKLGGKNVELIGNIGRAALDFLATDSEEKIYVFEMSSYQLEDFEGGADVALFVSFFPDHLDYHGNVDNYFDAKIKLAAQPKPGMQIIYNWHSDRLRKFFEDYQRAFQDDVSVNSFNNAVDSKLVEIDGDICAVVDDQVITCSKRVALRGNHNLENILAVTAVAKVFNIDLSVITEAIENFTPLEHRLEFVGTYKDISFYNDAISTTPESTIAALKALDKPISTLICGGMDRGYHFEELARCILDTKVENLILLPDTGEKIERAVNSASAYIRANLPTFTHLSDMQSIVKTAYQKTSPNTICLLSCAAPSYNLFKNFEDRGKQFKDAIQLKKS